MPARRLEALGLQSPSGNVRRVTIPHNKVKTGYNPLGQFLELAWIIFNYNK